MRGFSTAGQHDAGSTPGPARPCFHRRRQMHCERHWTDDPRRVVHQPNEFAKRCLTHQVNDARQWGMPIAIRAHLDELQPSLEVIDNLLTDGRIRPIGGVVLFAPGDDDPEPLRQGEAFHWRSRFLEIAQVDVPGKLLKRLAEAGELERTMIVISGDHGAPGFPGGKCNQYDFGVGVSLVVAWPGQPGGRVVDDFVNLMDLAPTFLEAGGVKPPDGMNGRSLVPVIQSDKSGQEDPSRSWVITDICGREERICRTPDADPDQRGRPARDRRRSDI